MAGKVVAPEWGKNSFSCPHCGTLTSQTWYGLYAEEYKKENGPSMLQDDIVDRLLNDSNIDDQNIRDKLITYAKRQLAREIFFDYEQNWNNSNVRVTNLTLSECYACDALAVWEADRLLFPASKYVVEPNEDIPTEILTDFREAANIVDLSPRGAAALLRLCIQKLAQHLGEDGRNLNTDIGNLVKKGMDPRIQQSLDVVRVVGNNAVHPGVIDLKDDRSMAIKLFGLVNGIAEAMITRPKHIKEIYETVIPDTIRAQIEKRDGPKTGEQ